MDSSFFLSISLAAIGFFTLMAAIVFMFYESFRFRQNNEIVASSLSLSSPLSRNWTHQVFPSFYGEDVRRDFFSYIQKEFQRKGITPFIDDEIKRGESIGPELKQAIRVSKIAIILLSRNYASSSWCLNELVEIMKCREELGQVVMAIFYKVDPTDVKKQIGYFGKVFKNTCKGKTKDDIRRWRHALEEVATVAGYHSSNWRYEADMIEEIATDVSNVLNNSIPSIYFEALIGIGAHLEKMRSLLSLESDEVRMVGIWGPAGIGKTTIARALYEKLCGNFTHTAFMESTKGGYRTNYLDNQAFMLHLQEQLLSETLNQKDLKIHHLGVAQERLKDKKVLVVLDDVDRLVQLSAMADQPRWFGRGSRIIITTQDKRLLKAHGIDHIYKVGFPIDVEALQIFCMHAFGKKSPKIGFEELAQEVTKFSGKLPLGLRVMGSHFRGMSKQEWTNELPRVRTSLHDDIESILKFSYDGLSREDQNLFLHIACFFNFKSIETVEDFLAKSTFANVKQGLCVLAEKSLISIDNRFIEMHNLLRQLGRNIVRNQSVHEPGHRQFLVDAREICEVLTTETGSKSLIGIHLNLPEIDEDEINISERAFGSMCNLQFLIFYDRFGDHNGDRLHFPQRLNYLSGKLRLLHWTQFPMTCLPSNFNPKFLVKLEMCESKLEKIWEGIQKLQNLKWVDLSDSQNLKSLPDFSTATNLRSLDLRNCSSLLQIPYSIGNAINLEILILDGCSSLVELPTSIGNLHKLFWLRMKWCSKIEILPVNINLASLNIFDLTGCSLLKSFPEISSNITYLKLNGKAIKKVPLSIKSMFHLSGLDLSGCKSLKEFPPVPDSITDLDLSATGIEKVPSWIETLPQLLRLELNGCRKILSLPELPDSLSILVAENCTALERLDCSFYNHMTLLNFTNCVNLNREARYLIIQSSTRRLVVLPSGEVPPYFTHQSSGSSLVIPLNNYRHLSIFSRFKACILLAPYSGTSRGFWISWRIWCKRTGPIVEDRRFFSMDSIVTDHILAFECFFFPGTGTDPKIVLTYSDLFFAFEIVKESERTGVAQCWREAKYDSLKLTIMGCGVRILETSHVPEYDENFKLIMEFETRDWNQESMASKIEETYETEEKEECEDDGPMMIRSRKRMEGSLPNADERRESIREGKRQKRDYRLHLQT